MIRSTVEKLLQNISALSDPKWLSTNGCQQ